MVGWLRPELDPWAGSFHPAYRQAGGAASPLAAAAWTDQGRAVVPSDLAAAAASASTGAADAAVGRVALARGQNRAASFHLHSPRAAAAEAISCPSVPPVGDGRWTEGRVRSSLPGRQAGEDLPGAAADQRGEAADPSWAAGRRHPSSWV